MAIIRSRAVASEKREAHRVSNPFVDEALAQWEERLEAAREEGRVEGRKEAQQALAQEQAALDKRKAEIKSEEQQVAAAEKAATKQVEQRFEPLLKSLSQGIEQVAEAERRAVEAAEHETVRLALHMAARLLRREVHTDERWMDSLLREALALVPDRRAVALRMQPTDIACLRDRLAGVAASSGIISEIEVIEDGRLPRGSCIIESAGTVIDASLNQALDDLAATLLNIAPPPADGERGEAVPIGPDTGDAGDEAPVEETATEAEAEAAGAGHLDGNPDRDTDSDPDKESGQGAGDAS